jgi:uncharacterized protein YbjQ (UPF0145 family)
MTACKRAAIQALQELQRKAKTAGANAVVNIVSYYKNNTFASTTQYECHAGGTGGHLTFKGTLVTLK